MNSKPAQSRDQRTVLIFLLSIFLGGPLLAIIIILLTTPAKPNQAINPQNPNSNSNTVATYTPAPVDTNALNASVSTPAKHLTYIPDIVSIDSITSDENFNHLIQITIKNPYNKPISIIQVYISDTGNSYIPEGISEEDAYLRNMRIDPLKPHTQGTYTLSTNDNGAKDINYAVSARRIRFTDGTTVEP
jgi:hypothetical protein